MGATPNDIAIMNHMANMQSHPRTFLYTIYNISGKGKKQIEKSIELHIQYLEHANRDLKYKKCTQTERVNNEITFVIEMELR